MQTTRLGSLTLFLIVVVIVSACDDNSAAPANQTIRATKAHSPIPAPSTVQFETGERVSVFGLSFTFPSNFERYNDLSSDFEPSKTLKKSDERALFCGVHRDTYMVVLAEPRSEAERIKKIDHYLGSLSHQAITIGNLKGKRYEYDDEDGYRNLVVRIETASHSFVLHTATNGSRLRTAKRFLDSIRGSDDSDLVEKDFESQNDVEPPDGQGRGGPDRGPDPFETGPAEPTATPATKKLKILSKPRPNYTTLARIYHIQGNVILRAKFNADGTLEHVKTIKPLPFGLTGASIRALMKIKFTPQTTDGKPESVAKNVEYTFTIF